MGKRKILHTFRSRNCTALFIVVRDGTTHTMEVWKAEPTTALGMEHCKTWPFEPSPQGPVHRSNSEVRAARLAMNLANALSRLSPSEIMRQAENLKQFGEVR